LTNAGKRLLEGGKGKRREEEKTTEEKGGGEKGDHQRLFHCRGHPFPRFPPKGKKKKKKEKGGKKGASPYSLIK